jgi:hypothetical protein
MLLSKDYSCLRKNLIGVNRRSYVLSVEKRDIGLHSIARTKGKPTARDLSNYRTSSYTPLCRLI